MSDPFDAFDAFESFEPPPAAPPRRWAKPPRAASKPERPTPPERASAAPSAPAPDALGPDRDETDLTTFRAVALPELRAAADRLGHRGHDADIQTRLDPEDPRFVLRFRPDAGPLAGLAVGPRDYARFELRFGREPNTGVQIVAGYTSGAPGALFVVLGRTRLGALTPDWVAARVIEFVARTLERS